MMMDHPRRLDSNFLEIYFGRMNGLQDGSKPDLIRRERKGRGAAVSVLHHLLQFAKGEQREKMTGMFSPSVTHRRRSRQEYEMPDRNEFSLPERKRLLTEQFQSLQVAERQVAPANTSLLPVLNSFSHASISAVDELDSEHGATENKTPTKQFCIDPAVEPEHAPWEIMANARELNRYFSQLTHRLQTSKDDNVETSNALVVYDPQYPPAMRYYAKKRGRKLDDLFSMFLNHMKKQKPTFADNPTHAQWLRMETDDSNGHDDPTKANIVAIDDDAMEL